MAYGYLIGFGVGISALLIISLLFSWFRVEEGHAVVLTRFGAPVRDADGLIRLFSSGLHLKWPWEHAHEFSLMERMMKIGEGGGNSLVRAGDGIIVLVDWPARFRFDPRDAEKFLFGTHAPVQHLMETFRAMVAEEIGRFGSEKVESGTYAELRKDRKVLDKAISNRVDGLRDRYGIEFRAVDLAEILPPADLAEALNGIQKVKAQFETLKKRVEAECERKLLSAEHGVEIARIRAEASEKEIRVLGETVGALESSGSLDAYIRRRRDESGFAARSVYMKS